MHPRHQGPHRSEITLAVVVSLIITVVDLRGAIGFSSFGMLLYYFIANVAAYTQAAPQRFYPKA